MFSALRSLRMRAAPLARNLSTEAPSAKIYSEVMDKTGLREKRD